MKAEMFSSRDPLEIEIDRILESLPAAPVPKKNDVVEPVSHIPSPPAPAPVFQDAQFPKDAVAIKIDEIFAEHPVVESTKVQDMVTLARSGDQTVSPPWGIENFYPQNGNKKRSKK